MRRVSNGAPFVYGQDLNKDIADAGSPKVEDFWYRASSNATVFMN